MKKRALSVVALSCLVLAGCSTYSPTREQTGMAIGGALGGVAGSQVGEGKGRTAATIIGAIAGAAIGGSIGRSMDDQDRMKTAMALENTRTGAATTWHNPDSGNEYTVVPTRTYGAPERPCRDYTMDARVGGRMEKVKGTACRDANGNWRITE